MTANAQKTPLGLSLNIFAQKKWNDAIQLLGKSLPASVTAVAGSIVTVKFEMNTAPFTLDPITVPLAGPQWIRMPTQVGDAGVVFPVDVAIGNVTGLGSGVPDFTTPANLASLVFFPVGNANWSTTDDPNSVVIYGPNGVILRDRASTAKVTVSAGQIKAEVGGKNWVLSSSGLVVNCDVTVNGKLTSTGTTSLGGGAQPVKLADGTNATNVKAT